MNKTSGDEYYDCVNKTFYEVGTNRFVAYPEGERVTPSGKIFLFVKGEWYLADPKTGKTLRKRGEGYHPAYQAHYDRVMMQRRAGNYSDLLRAQVRIALEHLDKGMVDPLPPEK